MQLSVIKTRELMIWFLVDEGQRNDSECNLSVFEEAFTTADTEGAEDAQRVESFSVLIASAAVNAFKF